MKKLLIALILCTGGLYAQGDGPGTDQDKPLDPIERLRQAYNNQKRPKQAPDKEETVESTPQRKSSPSVDSIEKLRPVDSIEKLRQAYAQKRPTKQVETPDKEKPSWLYENAKFYGKEMLINYIVLYGTAKVLNKPVSQRNLLIGSALGLIRLRVPWFIEGMVRLVL